MTHVANGGDPAVLRCDIVSATQLVELASAPLPLGVRASAPRRTLHRDLYLDTVDGVLRRRGVVCRLRVGADDRHSLSLRIGGGDATRAAPAVRVDAPVQAAEMAAALREDNPVTRRLRGVVDPALLEVRVVLEVERYVRTALPDWLRRPRVELHYDQVTVRRENATRAFQQLCVHRLRGRADDAMRLAQALQVEHGLRPLAADRRERAELMLKWMHPEAESTNGATAATATTIPVDTVGEELRDGDADFLNPDLSLLAFQERVLALAEDPATPLAERLRFLAIVAANLDEFFTVRVAGLKIAARESMEELEGHGLTPDRQLQAVGSRAAALAARQYRDLRDCVAELARRGVRLRTWAELDDTQRAALTDRFVDEIQPALTPLAMTLSPGHPFPHLTHLTLSLATVLLDRRGGPPHLAQVEIPDSLPRFLRADGRDEGAPGDLVLLEDVIRANLDALYPTARVDQAYFFRVTRAGDLQLDEEQADDLLEAVDEATRKRPQNAVVRVEVERAMPAVLRDLVLDELRREPGADALMLGADDVYEVDGPLDVRALERIPLPDDPAIAYPPFFPADPAREARSIFELVAQRELLVHHPFESFAGSVLRFLREAAEDPAVTAIKMTLYRAGDRSPVIEALRDAAKRGKQVVAFVELRARFDEERNVGWVRALEKAGVHVVYGLVGIKTHAKAALVVRREAGQLRRYAHVGTGNYNARTAQAYTDVSLLSADEALTGDIADLFNGLSGSSAAPEGLSRGALVSPVQLLPALLERIEREAAHARAGRAARIRIKVNGLSDAEVVRALCRAAQDGVRIELAVRGICTLRPGVPGLSPGVRVVATTGRFLEHSRIFHFENGGDPRYYIGSADLRPRNLRRRVELLVPVRDPDNQDVLDRLLALYLADPTAWELTPTGAYLRRGRGAGAQDRLLEVVRES